MDKKSYRISQKWIFAVMGFFAVFCAFAMRMCISLTIPKMVKQIIYSKEFQDDSCPSPVSNINHTLIGNRTITTEGTYDWSEHTQGIILCSFYIGYVISHVPGGLLAERFGGKHVLGLGILFTAICTILTPVATAWGGANALISLRILAGLSEGTVQPAISAMLAQWIPAEETSTVSSFVHNGSTFGVLFISLVLGPVIRAMDWPGVYYMFGGLSVLWYLLWMALCYNNPREHPFISEAEAQELEQKLGAHVHENAPPVPWRRMLSSVPFLALVAATVGRDWGGYTFMSDMPKYTMSVLKFTVDEVGWYSVGITAFSFASSTLFSWLSDWLIESRRMSKTNVRKLMATLGLSMFGSFNMLSMYVGCDKLLFASLQFTAFAMAGAGFPGIKVNVLDLSPNYAGSVMAVSHGLAGLCGIGGPYVVGILAPNQTQSEWKLVFSIVVVVCIVTNIIFLLFADGEIQDWNDPKKRNKEVELQDVKELKQKLLTLKKIEIVNVEGVSEDKI